MNNETKQTSLTENEYKVISGVLSRLNIHVTTSFELNDLKDSGVNIHRYAASIFNIGHLIGQANTEIEQEHVREFWCMAKQIHEFINTFDNNFSTLADAAYFLEEVFNYHYNKEFAHQISR